MSKAQKEEWSKKVKKLTDEIDKFDNEIKEIKSNKIYENAFEWRFEFPEVLNNDGDFVGFDVVIGNPPYIPLEAFEFAIREYFKQIYPQFERKYETSVLFIMRAFSILNKNGVLTFIAPGTWQTGENYSKFRSILIDKKSINTIVNLPFNIFEDAFIDTSIYFLGNTHQDKYKIFNFDKKDTNISLKSLLFNEIALSNLQAPDYKLILDPEAFSLYKKYSSSSFVALGEITKSTQGLSGSRFNIAKDEDSREYLFPFLSKGNVYNYLLVKENVFQTDLSDKKSLTQFYDADPKILFRRIINRQNRLSVGFTEERMVFKKDINPFICVDKRFSTKFLLGILASKLISFIYIKMSSIALKDDFRQTTLGELRKLPIPRVNTTKQKVVIDIVDQILDFKISDPLTNTALFEAEIDRLVYELYGLTEEEIRIVEGS
jgi:adenine-specific DNA-methyltransferase